MLEQACDTDSTSTTDQQTNSAHIIAINKRFNRIIQFLKMSSCIPCQELDPDRKKSKQIQKELDKWNEDYSKAIQLLLVGELITILLFGLFDCFN